MVELCSGLGKGEIIWNLSEKGQIFELTQLELDTEYQPNPQEYDLTHQNPSQMNG